MSFFKTDYKEVGDGNFTPIPEGEYEAVISEAKKETFKSGNEGVKLTLTIRTDVDQPGQKRKVFDNLTITEKAMFKFQQVTKAAGFPEGMDFPSVEAFIKAVTFKAVRVIIKHEMYNGNPQDRVGFYKEATVPYTGSPSGGPAANPFATGSTPPPADNDAPPAPPTGDVKPPWEQ
jgi:hypothetical protein